ncbi:70 kDa peptidyl-prolyl isomerase-like isoform X2 [Syzygium oleosum]|uniref:70 kDa peptidyl-prolyl isomerase-like isoform X2 n=1 Tax=Syzygium oleosum TaxID=219896 RepID=UPI0024BB0609|nr:70 kDa peptidyl-prolyl isomerase-like isoform X2 [Syzygium oleosum]
MAASCLKARSDGVERSRLSEKEIRIGKGGLGKRILRKGNSWRTPCPGDQVHVRYSGRVEGGARLDSSSEGSATTLEFKLGQCEVIKGWDEGVATMKRGERAVFTIPPNLAYGEGGSPPLVPPNATLVFDIEMVSWTSIRDLTGDGGVLKKIITEGEGWATPRDADEVLVNYEVMLDDGTVISKSDGDVEFQIGCDSSSEKVHLCPAMSIAAKTMRKGEKAELAVKFSYGFRWSKSVPQSTELGALADSNLVIQLELIAWKSVVDVTGDKKVLKKIVRAGEGFDHPNEGSVVKVAYTGKFEDGGIFEKKGSTEEPFEYVALEEQVNEGLDRAILSMKKGEQALVTLRTNSVVGLDDLAVLANSVLSYEVELIDFTKDKPFWKMNAREKLEACESTKNDGNSLFKTGKFWCASKKYEKAEKYVQFDHCFTDEEKSSANALRLSCYLNNAACKLRLGDYSGATKFCTKALDLDPRNIKALYRRSQAYLKSSDFDEAEGDINKALILQPDNRDVKLVFKELKDKQKEYKVYQAEISRTMLSRTA